MTWIKLDDTCPDHPGLVGLSDAAFACWVRGLCYASRHLTDGFLPTAALRTLGTPRAAAELVAAGRWHEEPGGWRIHDYEERQRTREQVTTERERARARQQRHRSVTPMSRRDTPVSHADVTMPEVEVEESRGEEDPPIPPTVELSLALVSESPKRVDRFDEWWEAYPRKQEKIAARKAWDRVVRTVDPEVLVAAARRYAADPNREDAFTKLPTTWLNKGSWENGPLPARAGAGATAVLNGFLDRHRTPALTIGENA